MLKARTAVGTLKEYHPPLGGREGLRLDFNENTVGCSPRVLERLRQFTADDFSRYPERGPLEGVVADFLGLKDEEVLLTNGVDEGIHLLCETYLQPGDEVLIVVPTFALYAIYAGATGATVHQIPAGEKFCYPTEQVLARINARTRLIALATPNNPTGAIVSRSDILKLAQAAPDAAVLADEAYIDFGGESVMRDVGRVPNLFVARTFSKAFGMAGLRTGILAGTAAQMAFVRRVASPYNVNAAALACLPVALADREYVRDYVAMVLEGRARLEAKLTELGIPWWPSQANFVLANFGGRRQALVKGMRARGILVRDRNSDPGCADCVRMTLGTREHCDRLLAALDDVLAEIGAAREVTA